MNKSLDSFRFFSFLAVFLCHIGVVEGGYIGVQAFFVLSGFLLTPILLDMKESFSFKRYITVFYGRRALRICPLYFTYLAVIGVITLLLIHVLNIKTEPFVRFYNQFPFAVTYTYNFYHVSSAFEYTSLLTHFWSLAVEEQFYLVWPFFIWVCSKNRLPALLIFTIALAPLARGITFFIFNLPDTPRLIDNPWLAVYVLPLSHIDAFAIGGLLSISKNILWKHMAWPLIIITLLVGWGTQYIHDHYIDWQTLGYPSFMDGQLKFIWGYSLVNITFGSILFAIKRNSFLPWLLSIPFIQYLGKISYGLYVYHLPVIWFFLDDQYLAVLPEWAIFLIMLLVTILIATISYELLEKRFLLLKDRWFAKEPTHRGGVL